MKRRTQRRIILISQLLTVAGLGLAALWNVAALLLTTPGPGWLVLLVPLPGLLLWGLALAGPALLARLVPSCDVTYRLVYDASSEWNDSTARKALLNLAGSGCSLEITWARDGEGTGCWLAVSGYEDVLERLVGDVFPAGYVESDRPPAPGVGVVILDCRKEGSLPGPAELCQVEGVDGVFFRWRDPASATVAIWGPKVTDVAQMFADRPDVLAGAGEKLRFPDFVGDNPWPDLPPFPPSQANPGLAAVSNLQLLAPDLRVNGSATLLLGRDGENQNVGFPLPELRGMRLLQVFGQAAGSIAASLAGQAVQAGLPVFFLDGQGSAVTLAGRRLMREVAANRVLVCDVEHPAQSRFRLNPLWLPDREAWPECFPAIWMEWLRELGVTSAGLGANAYRHTYLAVMKTALVAANRNLALDPAGLRDALQIPDFLTLVGEDLSPLVGREMWGWWEREGKTTPNFDVHLRLGHLRSRLMGLFEIPEYRVLWSGPYLDPLLVLNDQLSLFWRLPDPRRRLLPYITSQLLAVTSLLRVRPAGQPVVVILHELEAGEWAARLSRLPAVRLVVAAGQVTGPVASGKQAALLLSRLSREDAEAISDRVGVRVSDLRRLPARRAILRRGQSMGTVDLLE